MVVTGKVWCNYSVGIQPRQCSESSTNHRPKITLLQLINTNLTSTNRCHPQYYNYKTFLPFLGRLGNF